MPADYVRIHLSQLRAGARLRAPLFDGQSHRNQLLLAAGVEVTYGQLELLRRRGITQVLVHRTDVEATTGQPGSRCWMRTSSPPLHTSPHQLFRAPPGAPPPTWKQSSDSFFHELERPQDLRPDPAVVRRIGEFYRTALASTTTVFDQFRCAQRINSSAVACIAEQQLEQASRDLDAYLSVGLQPVVDGYPSRHSLQTAMLAVSIGTIMGLNKDDLIELGMGCLLHDAGMMLVPPHILERRGSLSAADRLEVLKHPLYIANALARHKDIPQGVRATAYQIHERMNGSGYPRGRQHPQIHLFARIGAVADTYLAMISPRNGRLGLTPYEAIEKLLYATRVGLFDSAVVRAMLYAASLFPLGSLVTLSDGRTGRVCRSNRERYDRPVVEIPAPDFSPSGEIVNLAEDETLTIVRVGEPTAV
jgi:HD-GYP domain-containing protein (c-di-GMP phosphodiesterase class II)